MQFVTTLERDEDGVWVVECPSITGRFSRGKTREEALPNVREAIAARLEVRAERDLPPAVKTQQVEVVIFMATLADTEQMRGGRTSGEQSST